MVGRTDSVRTKHEKREQLCDGQNHQGKRGEGDGWSKERRECKTEEMTEAARWSEGKKILPIVDFTTQRLYERERELTDTLEERKDRKVRNVYFKIYLCKSRSGRCMESKNSRLESRRDSKPAEW